MSSFSPDWDAPDRYPSSNSDPDTNLHHPNINSIGYSVDGEEDQFDFPTPTASQNYHLHPLPQHAQNYPPPLPPLSHLSLNFPIDPNPHYPITARSLQFESVSLQSALNTPPLSLPPHQLPPPSSSHHPSPSPSEPSDDPLPAPEPHPAPTDSHPPQPLPVHPPQSSSKSSQDTHTTPANHNLSSSSSSSSGPITPADPQPSQPPLASASPPSKTQISKMAQPPQPAEKSRAGRKAIAAIRGGGGLGARGSRANVLQQVISKTRPRDLPPKPTLEDQKHLKQFSEMMAASLELQKRKTELAAERRLEREKLLASYQPTWEKDVLPNWKSVLRDDPAGQALRKMWWMGTMPPRHRGRLWHQCIGNAGAVGRSAFMKSVALAKSLMGSSPSRFPAEVLEAMDADIERTLPKLKLFQLGKPMHTEFRELLLAWSVFWRERPFYPAGSAQVAGMFLINMPAPDAFLSLVNITRKSCLSYFYNERGAEVEAFCRIFETLLAERMPKVYRNLEQRQIRAVTYLGPWLRAVYVAHLPIQLATRIMDVFVLEGDSFLFRIALALLEILEARLLSPERAEVEAVFTGEDRGARAIVARDTMAVYGERRLEEVASEEAYEEMGCHEERVFECLLGQSWNEALWERLVSRELPD